MIDYGYIYLTVNLINNKKYIGKCKRVFNPNYYGSSKHLNQSIQKYGKQNFTIKVLSYAENKNTLDLLEIGYIKYCRKLFGRENMYNIADGGAGGDTISKHPNRDNIVPKMKNCGIKNGMYGRKHLFDSIQKMKAHRPYQCGHKNPNYGKGKGLWIYNIVLQKSKIVLKNKLEKYIKQGWILGKGPKKKIELEIRYCKCGCTTSFICNTKLKKQFIKGHHLRKSFLYLNLERKANFEE